MDLNGLRQLIKNLREDFQNFKTNDFHNLESKVDRLDCRMDKLSTKVAWIVGIISALGLVANILLRVL